MTVLVLKIIAYVLMLVDHITYAFIPAVLPGGERNLVYIIGRMVGRPAFIIFAFLIVEGFYHTNNRIKYMRNLAIIALVSEIPFDILGNGAQISNYMRLQNSCWTLLVGFLAVWIVEIVRNLYFGSQMGKYYFTATVAIALAYSAAYLGKTDYGGLGVLCILIFYFFFRQEQQLVIGLFVWGAISSLMGSSIEIVGVVVVIGLLHFYKGEKGYSSKWLKILFYTIYPLHMLIIGIICYYNELIALF